MIDPIPPHVQLANMSRQYVVSRAIHTIARLNIADYMSEEPMAINTLAELSGTKPDLLDRLLRFLTIYGLFVQTDKGYALTALSLPLRSDDPNSIKDILSMVDSTWWEAFSTLELGLKSGISPFKHQHGEEFFELLQQNPEIQMGYDKGMSKLSAMDDKGIAACYDYSHIKHLVNVTHRMNDLDKAIQALYPHLLISQCNLEHLDKLPGADAYMMKGLLHDFSEEYIHQLLDTLYRHMPSHSLLLVAEQLIPEDDLPHTNKTMDIIMMVLVGGKQRTENEWRSLIEPHGYKWASTHPTKGVYSVMAFLKS
jgi:C-methyltransferase